MITVDSPIAEVFGPRSKKRGYVEKGLGIETVGDLLHHFPRRYVDLGDLTRVRPVEGKPLTFVGEVRSSRLADFFARGKKQYRVEVRVRTNGPDFTISRFSPYRQQAETYERQVRPGERGIFLGRAKVFNRTWQLSEPQWVMFGSEEARQMAGSLQGLLPIYPLTKGVTSFDLQKVVQAALDLVEVPDLLPGDLRERFGQPDVARALRLVHGPDSWGELSTGLKRFRFVEALILQLVLAHVAAPPCGRWAGRRAPAAEDCWRPSTTGCRSPSPTPSARSGRRSRPTWPSRTR